MNLTRKDDVNILDYILKKGKAVPLHSTRALGGCIAPTHSRPESIKFSSLPCRHMNINSAQDRMAIYFALGIVKNK
jgi:hypothetical protein